jgi:hypothetical protein
MIEVLPEEIKIDGNFNEEGEMAFNTMHFHPSVKNP